MNNRMYINGVAGISAQTEEEVFSNTPREYHSNIFPAVTRDYKEFIPVMALRRMSTAVKMGLTAALMALKDAGVETPDAIITGTGQGCKQDTEKFLNEMLDKEEALLAPTSFIQSTHNTIGGQIALNLNCNAYNVTYSQNSASLELALADAILLFTEHPGPANVLVGGVDEISENITSFMFLDGQLKKEEIFNLELLKTQSEGTITSEGAHFFTISSSRNEKSYAELLDTSIFNADNPEKVVAEIVAFLEQNRLSSADVDLVILGNNGDSRFDHFYHFLQNGIFTEKPQVGYKHLVGDYDTVSGYAMWLGCKILKRKEIPKILKLNEQPAQKLNKILLYNQYLGENHSLILLGST
ncbi:MAG TPA: beta-ketoacyl synthase chain length factor [Gillisia sp.]|nr:beta-ketoacyl synthase chain length factor [Gillisia sp.]